MATTKPKTKDTDDDFGPDFTGPAPKRAEPDDKRPSEVKGHITIKGEETDKHRLFQTSPDVKEWLTKSEAESKGFYWRDEKKLGPA
jgi:hypothetical protein